MSTHNNIIKSQKSSKLNDLKKDETSNDNTQDKGILDQINTMEVAPENSKPTTNINSTAN